MKKLLLLLLLIPSLAFAAVDDFWEKAAYGSIPGVSYVLFSGVNNTVGTSPAETLWREDSNYTFLTTDMSTPYLTSSSVNDASAGTGARTVRVSCVDSNYAENSEIVTLDGQNSVNLTISCMAINNLEVLTAGSGGVNAGAVRLGTGVNSSGVPTVRHGLIVPGENQSNMGLYTVPVNKVLICRDFNFSNGAAGAASGNLLLYTTIVDNGPEVRNNFSGFHQSATSGFTQGGATLFPEKTKINVKAQGGSSTGPIVFFASCALVTKASQFVF